MKLEIESSEPINFLIDKYDFEIGNRKIYKCKFKKIALKKNKSLIFSELYYITSDFKDIDNGAYVVLYFDQKNKDLIVFEFIRKLKEDIESIEYVVLGLIKNLGYDVKKYKKAINGFSYFKE
jgi:hypothetical protein